MTWYRPISVLSSALALAATLAHGQAAKISKIMPEEVVDYTFIDRPSIATDSKAQPHIVCDAGGNSRFMKYHNVNGQWAGGVFAVGAKGGRYNASRLYIGQIEIDSKDRAWISCKFGCKEFGNMLGQGIWCFRNVSTDNTPPEQFFQHVNVYKGMGVVTTDAKYPDQGVVIGTFGNYNIVNDAGQVIKEGCMNAGHGGEKVRARVGSYAPRFPLKSDTKAYQDGIWHTAMNGSSAIAASYQSSTRYKAGLGPVTWAAYGPYSIMGDDFHHPGLTSDLSDPRVAYIATIFYGKMCINIWDGTKMLFDTFNLKVLDYDTTFEIRHAPAITPAPGTDGGAFFFWTKGGRIKTSYVSKKGVQGPIMDITPGSSVAANTDKDGNIHLAYYNNGGLCYRKVLVSTLDTLAPAGVVTSTRSPVFRWTNTKVASYTLEISRDGVKLPVVTVSASNSWTPPTDLAVGDYSWRVKEGGPFSDNKYSPPEPFVIPPVLPTPVAPDGRLTPAPVTPEFAWDCDEPAANRFVIELFQNGDSLGTLRVDTNGAASYTAPWTASLPAGVYSWSIKSLRVLTDHTIGSAWTTPVFFQIGVPGAAELTSPAEGDRFQPGSQLITFNWNAGHGATGYKLKILKNGALFRDPIDNIAGTSQGVNALFSPGYYTVLVQSKNGDGNGPWSDPVTFEVVREMTPGGFDTLASAPWKLSWTRTKEATRYLARLSRYNPAENAFEPIRERWVGQSDWDMKPFWKPAYDFPVGAYRWSVTDYEGKKGLYTSVAYFQVGVPGRPLLRGPGNGTEVPNDTVLCEWADPSGVAKEFEVEIWSGKTKIRDTGFLPLADFDKITTYTRSFSNFSDTLEGKKLMWRVRGRNNKGVGPWSEGSFILTPVIE